MQTTFLRREDFATPTWKRLTQTLEAELQRLRELNDTEASPEKTATTRGRIAGIKKILSLAEQARQQPDGPDEAPSFAG